MATVVKSDLRYLVGRIQIPSSECLNFGEREGWATEILAPGHFDCLGRHAAHFLVYFSFNCLSSLGCQQRSLFN